MTKEFVEIPKGSKIAARVEGKSSLARTGLTIHMTAPTIHADFSGTIALEMYNFGVYPVRLRPGMRILSVSAKLRNEHIQLDFNNKERFDKVLAFLVSSGPRGFSSQS